MNHHSTGFESLQFTRQLSREVISGQNDRKSRELRREMPRRWHFCTLASLRAGPASQSVVAFTTCKGVNSNNFTVGGSTFSSQESEKDFGLQIICNAEFPGIARENGVYMEAAQMKRWLGQAGFPCGISHVELEIQGKDNTGKAQESLKEAGMTADIAED